MDDLTCQAPMRAVVSQRSAMLHHYRITGKYSFFIVKTDPTVILLEYKQQYPLSEIVSFNVDVFLIGLDVFVLFSGDTDDRG